MPVKFKAPVDEFKSSRVEQSNSTDFRNSFCGDISQPQDSGSVILRYLPGIQLAQQALEVQRGGSIPTSRFEPSPEIPQVTDVLREYFEPAKLKITPLASYHDRNIRILNLTTDPATNTTKTIPSLYIVARAIHHIQRTGENILIVVTTSGNKGTALRRSVERAIQCGLVTRDQLRVLMIVPENSIHKLRSSTLSEDPELQKRNPLVIYRGTSVAQMKQLGKDFQERYFDEVYSQTNTRIWYSLNLDNYKIPDSVRAYYEYEWNQQHGIGGASVRLAVQPVSSAYGLLGYHLGRTALINQGISSWDANCGYWLVQHLYTSDMVRHIYFGDFGREHMPAYTLEDTTGLYCQDSNPHFPFKTFDPEENLDSTFYTQTPATSPDASAMIRQFGGGGNVVSLAECLDRYPFIRRYVADAGFQMPADPRHVREWALPMVMTGVLNAIDRDLIPEGADLTIHATGFSTDQDFQPLNGYTLPSIDNSEPLANLRDIIR